MWWRIPVLLLAAVKDGVVEEVLVCQDSLLHRLRQFGWGDNRALATSALVRSYHLYQGIGGFAGNAVMGLLFGRIYQRTGRTMPLVIAHVTIDAVAFVGYALLAGKVSWLPVPKDGSAGPTQVDIRRASGHPGRHDTARPRTGGVVTFKASSTVPNSPRNSRSATSRSRAARARGGQARCQSACSLIDVGDDTAPSGRAYMRATVGDPHTRPLAWPCICNLPRWFRHRCGRCERAGRRSQGPAPARGWTSPASLPRVGAGYPRSCRCCRWRWWQA